MQNKIFLILKIGIIIGIITLTCLIFFHQSELTSLDLGRHLKNGEMVFLDKDVLYKNFYSFTEPDFPFVNHHWLSGVIFYWLFLLGGFKILSVFNILIALLTVGLIFKLTLKRSNFWLASLLILPVILVLNERTNIRPEIFSYLFLALTFYLLDQYKNTQNKKTLFWFIPIFLVWINLHIYFFLGLFLVCLFLIDHFVRQFLKTKSIISSLKECHYLIFITICSFLISLLNPHFYRGLLYPLKILKEYGYQIVENKSPLYLENLMIDYNITIFKILVSLLIISYLIYFWKKQRFNIFNLGLTTFFTFSAFFAIRNLPIFALLTLPIMAGNFSSLNLIKKITQDKRLYLTIISLILLIYIITASYIIYDSINKNYYLKEQFGIGLSPGSEDSIKFFKDNDLSGPIFNNYDLGSALIFWLYPKEPIFVDNRPEAYSVEFFTDIYKPMQQVNEAWQKYNEKYNLNLIYFSHTDSTPWAKEFIRRRLHDDNWPLIYFDRYIFIMIKNNQANQNLINQYKFDEKKFISRIEELKKDAPNKNLLYLAALASSYGQNEQAEIIFQEILKKQPNNRYALASLGSYYSAGPKREQILKSLTFFERALSEGYKLPGIYNQMGLNYWNLLDYQQARKMWQQALDMNPDDEHAKKYLKQADELLR